MNQNRSARDLVSRAHHELFTDRDVGALERYFVPNFIEHSPLVKDGLAGLRELVQTHPKLHHEPYRVLQDGDLVAIHGRFTGLDDQPLVGFDLYRVADGLIVEHWDGLVPQSAPNASDRTQLDGPTETGHNHDREKNRELVVNFFTRTLIEGHYDEFRNYTNGEEFRQHSPDIPDGTVAVVAFLKQLKDEGRGLHYAKIHRTVADGQFVLSHSEGSIAGVRHSYFELWRVENGKVAELWDAITPVPEDEQALHRHGIF
ncbi:nuclear transport factor 2 family protein [Xenorhabdus hominickii]|uniref:Polyketide cyclase n=1 Tax=Xenorhabdus hominickii TaxID=351679 RepID=A0A2G0Q2Y0_XENHO|nr:nuclear transport factor 2 family protein [Xenorhabdus hominickii]AOM39792.1 polyketide cyclase [Xenorhabdus hominickii]PHM53569.1 polyketide cyclase [Xenorhabdus hominickii]